MYFKPFLISLALSLSLSACMVPSKQAGDTVRDEQRADSEKRRLEEEQRLLWEEMSK